MAVRWQKGWSRVNLSTIIDGDILEMEFSPSMDDFRINQKKSTQEINCVALSANSYSLILNGKTYYIMIIPQLDGYKVTVNHHTCFVQVQDKMDILLEKFGIQSNTSSHSGEIHAQIPGLVSRIFIKAGDTVKTGETLCILEAMKMENEITSPKGGTINKIYIETGANVEKGDLLMEITD